MSAVHMTICGSRQPLELSSSDTYTYFRTSITNQIGFSSFTFWVCLDDSTRTLGLPWDLPFSSFWRHTTHPRTSGTQKNKWTGARSVLDAVSGLLWSIWNLQIQCSAPPIWTPGPVLGWHARVRFRNRVRALGVGDDFPASLECCTSEVGILD